MENVFLYLNGIPRPDTDSMFLILMSLQVTRAVSRVCNVTKTLLDPMMISCVNGRTETIPQMLFILSLCSMLLNHMILFSFSLATAGVTQWCSG